MTYRRADFTSEEGRSFPYAYLSSDEGSPSLNSSKLKVWIQGGVHGNEPASDMGTLALLGKMDAEPDWTSGILEKMDIIVLPRYNPDGEFCMLLR
jgi:murein tripeptide amidase MpaA